MLPNKAQSQNETLYMWKNGVVINQQSVRTADLDSITFSSPEVTICNQVWATKNLNVSTYRNGDPIPQVTDPTQWANLTTGAWCYYNNDAANGPIYGKLYNWHAVNDSRGLAPTGWHVPTDIEWTTLTDCLGGESVAGGQMKATGTLEAGTGLWSSPNTSATNSSGFTALPSGIRYNGGPFAPIGSTASWWSSTEILTNSAWNLILTQYSGGILTESNIKTYGYSVRCIKN